MNSPENGKTELTASGERSYHGNMADSGQQEVWNPDNRMRANDNSRERPVYGVVEGGLGRQQQAEARKGLEKTDTGKSLKAYEAMRPREKWNAADYANVVFMLKADDSEEAKMVKAGLEEEMRKNEKINEKEYFNRLASLEIKEKPQGSGRSRSAQEKPEKLLTIKQIEMNYDQWKKMTEAGELDSWLGSLSGQQLTELFNYWHKLLGSDTDMEKSREIGQVMHEIKNEISRRPDSALGGGGNGENGGRSTNGGGGGKNGGNGAEGSSGGAGGGGGSGPGGSGEGGGGRSENYLRRIATNTDEMVKQLNVVIERLEKINSSIKDMGSQMTAALNKNNEQMAEDIRRRMQREEEEFIRLNNEAAAHRQKIAAQERERAAASGELDLIGQESWGAEDEELYSGNINDVLGERMKRIRYFVDRRKGGEPSIPKLDISAQGNNPNEEGISEEVKARRIKAIRDNMDWERMEELYKKSELKGDIFVREAKYLQELQRWVRVVIRNSQFGEDNTLKISNKAYENFKAVLEIKPHLYQHVEPGKSIDEDVKIKYENDLKGVIEKLDQERFVDYFKGNVGERETVTYTGNYGKAGGELPNSAEETMQIIANTYSEKDVNYHTGGNYELVNAQGELKLKNFWEWINRESYKHSDNNSQGGIDLLNMINIKTRWSELQLVRLLETPQYLQHREFTIKGNAEGIRDGEKSIEIGWGEGQPHPELNKDIKEGIKRFLWMTSYRQTDWAKYYDPQVRSELGKWLEAQNDEARNGNYVRGGYGFMKYQAPSSRGSEVIDFFKKKKAGSLGQAEEDAVMLTRYLSEFTEFYMDRDKKTGKTSGVKELEDNMAYSVLDYDGSSAMLLHLSEVALERSLNPAGVKERYKKYIIGVMDVLEEKIKNEIPEKDRGKLKLLVDKYKDQVDKTLPEKLRNKVLLDKNAELTELMTRIETEILGKSLISEDEYSAWEGFEEKEKLVVARGVVEKEARKLMRANLYEKLFAPLMGEKLGKGPDKKIGDLEVWVDNNKRVVTQKEWAELEANGRSPKKITVGEIMEEFRGFGSDAEDELLYAEKLEKAEKAGDALGMRRLTEQYKKLFHRNERLAFGLLSTLTTMKRSDLNYFNRETSFKLYNNHTISIMGQALGDVYRLNSNEVNLVQGGAWYTAPQYRFDGINNTSGSRAVSQATAFNNTFRAMNVDLGLEEKSPLHGEIRAIIAPSTLESWRVHLPGDLKPKTFLEVMQDGTGGKKDKELKIQHRWNRKLDGERRDFDTPTTEMQYDFINGIHKGGSQLIDVLFNEKDFNFQQVMTVDIYGNRRFDHEKAGSLLRAYWEPIRKVYNKTHIDYDKKVHVEGREMTMREYMFGDKTRETLDLLERYYLYEGEKKGKDATGYKQLAEKIQQQPAVAVLVNMVATEIASHNQVLGGTKEEWSLDTCDRIWAFLYQYLRESGDESWEGNKRVFTKKPSMLPYALYNRALGVHGGSMERYALNKLTVGMVTALFAGMFEVFREWSDELVQVNKVNVAA